MHGIGDEWPLDMGKNGIYSAQTLNLNLQRFSLPTFMNMITYPNQKTQGPDMICRRCGTKTVPPSVPIGCQRLDIIPCIAHCNRCGVDLTHNDVLPDTPENRQQFEPKTQRKTNRTNESHTMDEINWLYVFMAVGFVFAMIGATVKSCNMGSINEAAILTRQGSEKMNPDDFFSDYAVNFSAKDIYDIKCNYNPGERTLLFSGDFTAQAKMGSDLGDAARWQVENVLPQVIVTIGPHVKHLNALILTNSIADSFGRTAIWRGRLDLSNLPTGDEVSTQDVKDWIKENIKVEEDTASGRDLGMKRH